MVAMRRARRCRTACLESGGIARKINSFQTQSAQSRAACKQAIQHEPICPLRSPHPVAISLATEPGTTALSVDFRRTAIVAALAAASFAIGAPAQANFLERLFGVAPRPVLAPESTPLHMTVRPKHRKSGQPAATAGKHEPPIPRVTPMEYANDPLWYLKDPTLKKGDVIVLQDRVVVFNGGERSYSNFLGFQSSRLLSERGKKQLRHLVSTPRDTHTIWEPAEIMKSGAITTPVEVSESAR